MSHVESTSTYQELVKARKEHDEATYIDWMDPQNQKEHLRFQGFQIAERDHNPLVGMGVAIGTIGTRYTPETVQLALADHVSYMEREYGMEPLGASIAHSSGFTGSFWSHPVPSRDTLGLQVALGTAIGNEALAVSGVDKKKVKNMDLAISAPFSPLVGEYIATSMELSPDVQVRLYSGACYSQAMAAQQDREGVTIDISIETMMQGRLPVEGFGPGTTDRTMLSMFSDTVTAVVKQNPERFVPLLAVDHEVVDANGVLAAYTTHPQWGMREPGSSILWESPNGQSVDLPMPRTGQTMYMDALGTTKFFLKFLKGMMLGEEFRSMIERYPLATVQHATAHTPSFALWEKEADILTKLGLRPGLLEFDGRYGNAPCSIYAFEIARILAKMRPGHRWLTNFFGAGARGGIRMYYIR